MNNIQKDIEKSILENKDEKLAICNIVCSTLDKYSTEEIAKYYLNENESCLRYFLEQRISDIFMEKQRNRNERLNTH